MEKIKIVVEGMHCMKCEGKVERAIAQVYADHAGLPIDQVIRDDQVVLDPQDCTVRASSQFGSVRVICDQATQLRPAFEQAISASGFVVIGEQR